MKKLVLFITAITIIFLLSLKSTNAQDSIQKIKIYKTWVYLDSEPFKIKGVLYEVKDSSISVSNSLIVKDYSVNNFDILYLNINNIEEIQTRRLSKVGRGILIGAITGFAVGGLIGLIDGDDPPGLFSWSAETKALVGGVYLANLGVIIGAGVGSFKVKIPINGNQNNYKRNKNKLREYSIMKK